MAGKVGERRIRWRRSFPSAGSRSCFSFGSSEHMPRQMQATRYNLFHKALTGKLCQHGLPTLLQILSRWVFAIAMKTATSRVESKKHPRHFGPFIFRASQRARHRERESESGCLGGRASLRSNCCAFYAEHNDSPFNPSLLGAMRLSSLSHFTLICYYYPLPVLLSLNMIIIKRFHHCGLK